VYWGLIGVGLLVFFLIELNKESIQTKTFTQKDGLNHVSAMKLFAQYETGEIDNLVCACAKPEGENKIEITYQTIAPNTTYQLYSLCDGFDINSKLETCSSQETCRTDYYYKFLQLVQNFCENAKTFAGKNLKSFFRQKIVSRDLEPDYIVINELLSELETVAEDTSFQVYSPFKLISTLNSINNPLSPSWWDVENQTEIATFMTESSCSCSYDYDCKIGYTDPDTGEDFEKGCDEVTTILSFAGTAVVKYVNDLMNRSDTVSWNRIPWLNDSSCYNDDDEFVGDANTCFIDGLVSEEYFTLGDMIEEGFVPYWNDSSIRNDGYRNYFRVCNPPQCAYTVKAKGEPYEVVTVVLGVYGGISSILSAVYAYTLKQYDARYGKKGKKDKAGATAATTTAAPDTNKE